MSCKHSESVALNFLSFFHIFSDHTKVQYSINLPNVSSYPKQSLEDLRTSITILLFANYDDVIVSGVKNGSVIVTFMIRNYLVPYLKALLESEERIICQRMLEMKIFKVVIQDDIVYIRGICTLIKFSRIF